MSTPSDMMSSSEHVISTQPIPTDLEGTMSTTSDVLIETTQIESTDTIETNELERTTAAMDDMKTTTLPISTDPVDTTTTNDVLIDVMQTDSTDTEETNEVEDMLMTTVMDELEATTPPMSTDQEETISTTNNVLIDVAQTDGTDIIAGNTEDDFLWTSTATDKVQSTAIDATEQEVFGPENNGDSTVDEEGVGADSGEVFGTAGAMIISPVLGLIIALAFANLNLILF